MTDVFTDLSIITGNLASTTRAKKDIMKIEKILKKYPFSEYDYYITGHSLGGALLALYMRIFPFIKYAVAYNSASQLEDLRKQNPNIKYIFIDLDPLYNITGQFLANKEVLKYQSGLNSGLTALLPSPIQAHKLNQFERLY